MSAPVIVIVKFSTCESQGQHRSFASQESDTQGPPLAKHHTPKAPCWALTHCVSELAHRSACEAQGFSPLCS